MERSITIVYQSLELVASVHYPCAEKRKQKEKCWPVIIICHGFVGNRIGVNRLFVKAARRLAAEGYFVLRFDYAGCGESNGEYGSYGIDSFIEQTRYVLDYVLSIDCIDKTRVFLLGHSLGGAIARLTAERDTRVNALILWAPVAHPFADITRIIGNDAYEEAMRNGETEYSGYRLKKEFFISLAEAQPLASGAGFLDDALILHGTRDEVIPVDACYLYEGVLRQQITGECRAITLEGADHTFSTISASELLFAHTCSWLQQLETRKKNWSDWII
ncbi:alpha/beta hydrolase [Aneurinibacillus thermoaerophilus]|uniref:alpha/beta hydrolase n=1 Tax=Aneurinibacillus thermoaerophilus TaxID=143495 RepID=UPI002E1F0C97|nr:alpha/beta hydrolase [Aneurinibacillus thermoaerophilus]